MSAPPPLRKPLRLPPLNSRVIVHRERDALGGKFAGCVPPNPDGKSRRDRQRKLVIQESTSVVEYVPENEVVRLQVLSRPRAKKARR